MAKEALVISRTTPDFDSRFGWSATLQGIDTTTYPAIIFHDSNDDEATTLALLVSAYKHAPQTKFLYITAELNPLMVMFFHGIHGDIYDDEIALSDADIVLSLLEDYNDNPGALKPPEGEFSELRKAMERLLTGNLDEEEMHAIISSEDWRSQVKASMDTMTTSLVRITNSNRALVKYVNTTRSALEAMQTKINTVEADLAKALSATEQLQSRNNGAQENVISKFPQVSAPLAASKLLYIKEYSHCSYLISFLLAYGHYLQVNKGVQMRLLVIVPKTPVNMKHYSPDVFYNLSVDSINSSDVQRHNTFVTMEPKKNIVDTFFNTTNAEFFVIVDKLQDNILIKSMKMKTLYAVGSERVRALYNLDPRNVIRPVEGPAESIVLPYFPDYSKATTVTTQRHLYFDKCKTYFTKLDKMFDFE